MSLLVYLSAVACVAIAMVCIAYFAWTQRGAVSLNRRAWPFIGAAALGGSATACLLWLVVPHDLVPREWDSRMHAGAGRAPMEPSNFVKGGVIIAEGFDIELGRRNRIQFHAIGGNGQRAAPLDLGDRDERKMVVVGDGRLIVDGKIDNIEPGKLTFIVFTHDRIYLFPWNTIGGTYWMRR